MKVIVNRLNRRTSPVTDFADKSNIKEVVNKDFTFESVAQIANNLGIWHQSGDGLWAIQHGLNTSIDVHQYIKDRFDGTKITEVIDYNRILNIPIDIKNSGKNAIVGILDAPISTNINFTRIIRPGNICIETTADNHGNFLSGIIGSNKIVKGICFEGTIIDLTYQDTDGSLITNEDHYNNLIKCIESFNSQMVVINVSRSPLDVTLSYVLNKFAGLKNIFYVCSAGTNEELLDIKETACLDKPNAISVGTASRNFLDTQSNNIDKRLDVVFPILDYVSFNNTGLAFSEEPDISCSWATAVTSSIISLLFSSNQLNNNSTKTDIISKMKSMSMEYSDNYNFLNPLKFSK